MTPDKLKEAVDKTLRLANKAITERDAVDLAKRITEGTTHDDRRFHKVKLALRVIALHAENERLMETCHRDRTAVHDLVKQNQLLEAQVAAKDHALRQSLELDLCHETSCPFPMRAMCNSESHKIRRQAISIDAQPGRKKKRDGGV